MQNQDSDGSHMILEPLSGFFTTKVHYKLLLVSQTHAVAGEGNTPRKEQGEELEASWHKGVKASRRKPSQVTIKSPHFSFFCLQSCDDISMERLP